MGEAAVSGEERREMAVAAEGSGGRNMAVMNNSDVSAAASSAGAAAVRWESFLPKMVLRVLLVEADDSTRQIITALLRKCSYRVAAVSDGLKAWEVLKGRPHNIDLILTEVDLPSISGFALLTLIMEHEICKNTPVIMMSSQDSVSTVYKCMLRGAADFLVKPLRKNELRNLWQHVWRRQASSSGGVLPQDESTAQQKVEATAENNAISNNSCDMPCIQKNRENFEKGSDAQSSCTKPELEAEGAETECVQDLSQPKWSKPQSSDIDIRKQENHPNPKVQALDWVAEGSREAAGEGAQRMTSGYDKNSGVPWECGLGTSHGPENNYVDNDSVREVIDLIGAFDNYIKCAHRNSGSNAVANKVDPLPQLDLSLRRYPSGSVNQVTDERRRLNHSDASAFSRYVNRTTSQPQHSTSPTCCNQKKDQQSNSNKQLASPADICNSEFVVAQPGESETRIPCPLQTSLPAPVPVRGVRLENISNGYNTLMPQLFRTQSGMSAIQSSASVNHPEASFPVNAFYQLNRHQSGNSQQYNGLMVQNSSDMTEQNENMECHKLETAEDHGHASSATDQSASSNFCNGKVNHLHSLHGASNEKADAVPFMSTAECGNEDTFRVHDGNSLKSMQREAALNKFRLKRKERCFEKKVRYESRKKLAEKRPRVKGQFVRQALAESPPGNSTAG